MSGKHVQAVREAISGNPGGFSNRASMMAPAPGLSITGSGGVALASIGVSSGSGRGPYVGAGASTIFTTRGHRAGSAFGGTFGFRF